MQHVEEHATVGIGHTYAEPLWGLRVSWGSVLAGAVATVAVSLILWSLAFAIVSLGATPTQASMRGSAAALWICAMVATLMGAFVGGYLAGYLPGNPGRGIVVAHGFLSWCVSFLFSFVLGLALVRGAATMAVVGAGTTTEPTSLLQAPVAMTQSDPGLDPPQPPGAHGRLGPGPGERNPQGDASSYQMLKDSMVGMSWSWFGTWIVALGLAVVGSSMGAHRLRTTEPTVR